MKAALIVPAAGSGERLGMGLPKALVALGGVPLLRLTLERLARATQFAETVVLAPCDALHRFEAALVAPPPELGRVRVIAGGATRQQSVAIGVAAVAPDIEIVCVHDAARPLVAAQTVRAVLAAVAQGVGVTAAARPTDSVREDRSGDGSAPLDRSRLWLVETPQAFTRNALLDAHRAAEQAGLACTDDASLVEAIGERICIVESVGRNLKVTIEADLALAAEMIARESETER